MLLHTLLTALLNWPFTHGSAASLHRGHPETGRLTTTLTAKAQYSTKLLRAVLALWRTTYAIAALLSALARLSRYVLSLWLVAYTDTPHSLLMHALTTLQNWIQLVL